MMAAETTHGTAYARANGELLEIGAEVTYEGQGIDRENVTGPDTSLHFKATPQPAMVTLKPHTTSTYMRVMFNKMVQASAQGNLQLRVELANGVQFTMPNATVMTDRLKGSTADGTMELPLCGPQLIFS